MSNRKIKTYCQYLFKTQINTYPYQEIKKNPWIYKSEREKLIDCGSALELLVGGVWRSAVLVVERS
jgi:hypothetical protein